MDLTLVQTAINTLGVPVFAMVACGLFVYKMYQQQVSDKDKLYAELAQCRLVNAEAIEAVSKCVERLEVINSDIQYIKSKVGSQ